MSFNSDDTIQQIKSSLDITEIIGEKVRLRKTSRGWVGLCPFHDERTGSFYVFEDTQSYYCFGCHEAGDVFTFVMKSEGLEFRDALEILAARAGIKLPERVEKKSGKSDHEVIELAQNYFSQNLFGEIGRPARAYILQRGLEGSDARRFHIGYSAASWDGLVRELRKKGIQDSQMLKLGLAIQGRNGLYDRFRGRIMFPISDTAGRITAFGGRLIDGEGAKYINSPESEIYSKRRNLYLFSEARKSIREKQRSILTEGYMDAIRLHKCGFTETVASLGTSLTPEQAELLSKFADRCYICYDSDTAGQAATVRGMYILQENGLDVYVVKIPEGKDPDEFLISNPPEKFEEAIKNSRPLILAHIDSLRSSIENPLTRKSATKELLEGISRLKNEDIRFYVKDICAATSILPSDLGKRLNEIRRNAKKYGQKSDESQKSDEKKTEKYNPVEAAFCAMLYKYPELRMKTNLDEIYSLLKNPETQQTADAILSEHTENLMPAWLENNDLEKMKLLGQGLEFLREIQTSDLPEMWNTICSDLKRLEFDRQKRELTRKLFTGEATEADLKKLSDQFSSNNS